ncbi:RNA polymerase sigma factor [Roseiconus lacunae]|uniref:RNA polymerase sigma factor n=1 Tax=Roseiconus lacunae TaxID=2605694 RepID=UPI001E5D2227|nr:sigma-70 family RNA polymerase sigma factor [Roseiconus lacunae]MCD0461639.1 sigma-70 family RNA polymerase sigma factor [Roseiconus lacunae]
MESAFEKPIDTHRGLRREHAGTYAMGSKLSEREFAQCVDACMPRLVATARRLAGDEDLAADALQNALLKASKSWRRFEGRASLETWLIRILIHCVRDSIGDAIIRRERLMQETLESNDSLASATDPGRGPTEQACDAETDAMIRKAVMNLPHRQREVFSLVIWQGMSHDQVVEILGIRSQTVYANLHAARQRLKAELKRHLDGGRDPD